MLKQLTIEVNSLAGYTANSAKSEEDHRRRRDAALHIRRRGQQVAS